MTEKKFTFNLGSRKLFPEEYSVVDTVHRAVMASALKHGLAIREGSAVSQLVSKPMTIPGLENHSGSVVAGAEEPVIATSDKTQASSGIAEEKKPWPGDSPRPGANRVY